MFVSLDAPDHVSLFAYDNKTFIVQNFQSQPVSTRVSVTGATRLHDLLTDETITSGQGLVVVLELVGVDLAAAGVDAAEIPLAALSFDISVPGHSFRVFQAE